MSFLTDNLPEYICVDNKRYPIRTDFRVWLEFYSIMSGNLSTQQKISAVFRVCFDSKALKILPKPDFQTLSALFSFYNCNNDIKTSVNTQKTEKVFCFTKDAELIYSAFLQEYSIDLLSVPYLHWFCFCALFKGLGENTRLMRILSLRSIRLDDIKNPHQKEHYKRLKNIYALPDLRSEKQKDLDIAENLFQIF